MYLSLPKQNDRMMALTNQWADWTSATCQIPQQQIAEKTSSSFQIPALAIKICIWNTFMERNLQINVNAWQYNDSVLSG